MRMNKFEKQIVNDINSSMWPGDIYSYPHNASYKKIEVDLIKTWEDEKNINIYIHIPFCKSKCAYCGLLSLAMDKHSSICQRDYIEKYVATLIRDIKYFSSILKDVKIHGIFFGGGTPNMLMFEQVYEILQAIEIHFSQNLATVDICFETSPSLLTPDYIFNLKSSNVNRISMGIQSFNENELKIANRENIFKNIYDAVDSCHQYDLKFNIDLIIGLPKQTEENMWDSISSTIKLKPQSIALYPLTLVIDTPLDISGDYEGALSPEGKYRMFPEIYKFMSESNYTQQSNMSFIQSEYFDKCKSMYLKVGSLDPKISTLGLGAGARSYAGKIHYSSSYSLQQNEIVSIVDSYLGTEVTKREYEGIEVSIEENKRRYIMLTLTDGGMDISDYYLKFGTDVFLDFADEFLALNNLDLVTIDGNWLRLSAKGFIYADIISNIFVSPSVRRKYVRSIIDNVKKKGQLPLS